MIQGLSHFSAVRFVLFMCGVKLPESSLFLVKYTWDMTQEDGSNLSHSKFSESNLHQPCLFVLQLDSVPPQYASLSVHLVCSFFK